MWGLSLFFFLISFFTGTHLGSYHLWISLPSAILAMVTLICLVRCKEMSRRVRGLALTLLLFLTSGILLGWSAWVNTIHPLYHGVGMGLIGVGFIFLTYELYFTKDTVKT